LESFGATSVFFFLPFFLTGPVFIRSYIRYSAIAAKVTRRALKVDARAEAAKREGSQLKVTLWKDGKPQESEYRLFNSLHLKRNLDKKNMAS
jgi:hypothetical protein